MACPGAASCPRAGGHRVSRRWRRRGLPGAVLALPALLWVPPAARAQRRVINLSLMQKAPDSNACGTWPPHSASGRAARADARAVPGMRTLINYNEEIQHHYFQETVQPLPDSGGGAPPFFFPPALASGLAPSSSESAAPSRLAAYALCSSKSARLSITWHAITVLVHRHCYTLRSSVLVWVRRFFARE